MTGDGTNDAPALAQADVGVTMNTGTQAAREAGNMVDLDSNPTKLIEIVEVGKQLLITRGALTTFSIANDVAKYFAILPAIFAGTYAALSAESASGFADGPLDKLNVMDLGTPESAIISAIVFNALIIPLLVPLALRGVRYRAVGATALLRRNMLIYGLGGLIAPFVGIKAIDLIVHNLLGAVSAAPQDLPRHGGRGRQDLPDAAGGPCCGRGGPRRRRWRRRDAWPCRHGGARGRPRGGTASRSRVPRRDDRGDGPARHPRALARALPDRRARPYERARRGASEALR